MICSAIHEFFQSICSSRWKKNGLHCQQAGGEDPPLPTGVINTWITSLNNPDTLPYNWTTSIILRSEQETVKTGLTPVVVLTYSWCIEFSFRLKSWATTYNSNHLAWFVTLRVLGLGVQLEPMSYTCYTVCQGWVHPGGDREPASVSRVIRAMINTP